MCAQLRGIGLTRPSSQHVESAYSPDHGWILVWLCLMSYGMIEVVGDFCSTVMVGKASVGAKITPHWKSLVEVRWAQCGMMGVVWYLLFFTLNAFQS